MIHVYSLDTGNRNRKLKANNAFATNMTCVGICWYKLLCAAAIHALNLTSVMVLLLVQSLFRCDKDISGFQPCEDPLH